VLIVHSLQLRTCSQQLATSLLDATPGVNAP
jgi:hypothetical protein